MTLTNIWLRLSGPHQFVQLLYIIRSESIFMTWALHRIGIDVLLFFSHESKVFAFSSDSKRERCLCIYAALPHSPSKLEKFPLDHRFRLEALINAWQWFATLHWQSRDSSVGRASDWRSEGPRFDPGSRHFFFFKCCDQPYCVRQLCGLLCSAFTCKWHLWDLNPRSSR